MNEGDDHFPDRQNEVETRVLSMLRQIGRVSNEAGISHADDPVQYEPSGPIHAEMEFMQVHLADDGEIQSNLVIEVSICETCRNIKDHDLREILWIFNNLDQRFCIKLADFESTDEEEIRLRLQYKVGIDGLEAPELRSKIQKFMGIAMSLSGTIHQTNRDGKPRAFDALSGSEFDGSGTPRQMAFPFEIEQLVGLESVKGWARTLSSNRGSTQSTTDARTGFGDFPFHLIFTGSPGTGKSTVARSMGRYYKDLGCLSKGHVVEVELGASVDGQFGNSEGRVRLMCEKALGGVLFVDVRKEGYGLPGQVIDEGIIPVLHPFIGNNESDLVVILAGTAGNVRRFLEFDPRIEAYFDTEIHFPDFRVSELQQLFDRIVRNNEYQIEPWARELAILVMSELAAQPNFGNARDVRVLFERIYLNQVTRCDSEGLNSSPKRSLFLAADVRPLVGTVV